MTRKAAIARVRSKACAEGLHSVSQLTVGFKCSREYEPKVVHWSIRSRKAPKGDTTASSVIQFITQASSDLVRGPLSSE